MLRILSLIAALMLLATPLAAQDNTAAEGDATGETGEAEGPPPLPEAGPIGIKGLTGEWYATSPDGMGNTIEIYAVIKDAEWSTTTAKTVLDAFGLPVTYKSAQGGTLEVFPPKTIRFAVFWQEPAVYNGGGILLPPGSTFSLEDVQENRLLLLDVACAEQLPRESCLIDYQRLR